MRGASRRSSGKSSRARINASAASTARKLTALTAKQAPTPAAAITTPPIAGPTTREALKRLAVSATAFGSSSLPTGREGRGVRQLVPADELEGERVPVRGVDDGGRSSEQREHVDGPERGASDEDGR